MSHQSKTESRPRRGGFTFKQFFVAHDRCAMKVGTDGVLLGAWAVVEQARRILDIGCGSGLIALMLAQRTPAEVKIDAVEIDSNAASQANENVLLSPWSQKIQVYHQDIHEFAQQHADGYDLIVSNPPYFEPSVACRDLARTRARYTEKLTHHALLACAERLIKVNGYFCLVLPYDIGEAFEQHAHQCGWYTARRLNVSDRTETRLRRMMLTLSRRPVTKEEGNLAIKRLDGGYTEAFCQLITEFYLKY